MFRLLAVAVSALLAIVLRWLDRGGNHGGVLG
jgi:hypothetical protein